MLGDGALRHAAPPSQLDHGNLVGLDDPLEYGSPSGIGESSHYGINGGEIRHVNQLADANALVKTNSLGYGFVRRIKRYHHQTARDQPAEDREPQRFYLNVPVGLLAYFLCHALVEDPEYLQVERAKSRNRREPFDVLGLCLLTVTMVCWEIMLSKGQEWDWLGDPFYRVQGLLILFLLGLGGLIYRELQLRNPLVALRTMADRNFGTCCVIIFSRTQCSMPTPFRSRLCCSPFLVTTQPLRVWCFRRQGYLRSSCSLSWAPCCRAGSMLDI
jgi:hypothetical protein